MGTTHPHWDSFFCKTLLLTYDILWHHLTLVAFPGNRDSTYSQAKDPINTRNAGVTLPPDGFPAMNPRSLNIRWTAFKKSKWQTYRQLKKNTSFFSDVTSDIFWDLIIQHTVLAKQRQFLISGLVTCNDTWNLVISAAEIKLVNKFDTKSNKSNK